MTGAPEPTVVPLSKQQEDFLRVLARVVVFVPRIFDADIGRTLGMTSSEYFTLMHLAEAPEERLRMGELAEATALTFSAVTRVVHKLEAGELVQRRASIDDGRGFDAVLTDAGRARLAEAEPARTASLRHRIFDAIEGLDLEASITLLSRIGHER